MSNKTIQIKSGITIPTSLLTAELAFNTTNKRLYTSSTGNDIIDLYKESSFYKTINEYTRANITVPAINGIYNYTIIPGTIPVYTVDNPTQDNIWIKIFNKLESVTYFAIDFTASFGQRREFLQQNQMVELVSFNNYWVVANLNVSYNKMLTVNPVTDYIVTNSYYRGARIKTKQYNLSNAQINTWVLFDSGITTGFGSLVFSFTGFVFSNTFSVPFQYRNNALRVTISGLEYFIDSSIASNNFVNICIEYIN